MKGSKDTRKSFETHMTVWNNILSYLGMAPVLSKRDTNGELVIRPSAWKMLFSLGAMFMSGAMLFFSAKDRKFDVANIGNALISWYMNLTGNVVMCFNVFSALFNVRSYADLASCILKFNTNSLNARVDLVLVASAKFLSVFLFLLLFGFFFDFIAMEEDHMKLGFLLNYIGIFYNGLCVCHYAICCFYLREYLLGIQMEVRKHSKLIPTKFHNTHTAFIKLNVVRPEDPQIVQSDTDSAAIKMKYIRRLYHQIFLLSNKVNAVFSSRNLLTVAHNFFLSTILVYCGLNEIVKHTNGKSKLSDIEIINFFKYSVMSFLYIYGLIWPSNKVYYEVHSITMLVQEYFTKVPKGELQLELHSFVMQLYHEKIIFSPHGFFSLSNKLILSIIGSAASYLVILVQFRITVI